MPKQKKPEPGSEQFVVADPAKFTDCSSPAIAKIAVQAGEARSDRTPWSSKDWNSNWQNRRT